jgi:hypothetical protein
MHTWHRNSSKIKARYDEGLSHVLIRPWGEEVRGVGRKEGKGG